MANVRVNTYRRLDLLKEFLEYYVDCDIVEEIQVVWSDLASKPPDWTRKYLKSVFEIHLENNSLTNRFIPLIPIKTEVRIVHSFTLSHYFLQAVLSIDDDLIIPCSTIRDSHNVWRSNKKLVVYIMERENQDDV